jgi:hypothetical protein
MKSATFVRGDRDADVARGERIAAGAVDPVAEPRLREQPRADDRDPDPPQHLHLEVVLREIAREEMPRRLETACTVDVLDRGRVREASASPRR